MTVRRVVVVLAFTVLFVVVFGMIAASEGPPEQLGPYPTGDGDNVVVVAPRAAP